jgi:hypothetical protein
MSAIWTYAKKYHTRPLDRTHLLSALAANLPGKTHWPRLKQTALFAHSASKHMLTLRFANPIAVKIRPPHDIFKIMRAGTPNPFQLFSKLNSYLENCVL